MAENLLNDKKILIVDDEPDVLETLEDELSIWCKVTSATNFNQAKKLLETQEFDLVILDIMGVKGYDLLQIAIERNVIPVMLTAHALNPEDIAKPFKGGAANYFPKDEIVNITTFLNDIFDIKKRNRFWWRWSDWLGLHYKKRFRLGSKKFWERFSYWA